MKSKKAMELPINIVVMLIIGIILFGIGLSLFGKISKGAEANVEDLNNKVKTGIAKLECDGDRRICSPSYTMKNGKRETFDVYISNLGDTQQAYTIEYQYQNAVLASGPDGWLLLPSTSSCGTLLFAHPNIGINVRSGESGSLPFEVKASRVTKTPCSFIVTARLMTGTTEVDRTAVVVLVE